MSRPCKLCQQPFEPSVHSRGGQVRCPACLVPARVTQDKRRRQGVSFERRPRPPETLFQSSWQPFNWELRADGKYYPV